MEINTCIVCKKEMTNVNRKNIFNDNLYANLNKSNEDNIDKIKIYEGIQIVTGYLLQKSCEKLSNICETCTVKLQTYVEFRKQLKTSLKNLNVLLTKEDVLRAKIEVLKNINKLNEKNSSNKSLTTDDSSLSENSELAIFNQSDTTDSIVISAFEDELDSDFDLDFNNAKNDSSSSIEVIDSSDNSGKFSRNISFSEKNEVMKYNVQKTNKQPDVVKSNSDSDSDICDYEPSGKRSKTNNALTPPKPF